MKRTTWSEFLNGGKAIVEQILAPKYRNKSKRADTKTNPVFSPADGETSWLLPPSLVSLLSGSTVQQENTYPCILKMTGQVWESQKE